MTMPVLVWVALWLVSPPLAAILYLWRFRAFRVGVASIAAALVVWVAAYAAFVAFRV